MQIVLQIVLQTLRVGVSSAEKDASISGASCAQMRPIVLLALTPPGKQLRVLLEHQRHRAIETRRAE
ncbi:hypothetical protein [Methylosinus sp. C49]|uniref:hypothetical protein n=1 Tax=Methylosinus sp. C49 TaxID=2699395 RepID=UPI0013799B03|nr:hypothetical protein [Methylosinus sp. C49]